MRLRQQMFEALMTQEMAWYDDKENNVGAICAKLAGETANVQGVRKTLFSVTKKKSAVFFPASFFIYHLLLFQNCT